MSLMLFIDVPCPKCQRTIRHTIIDIHPTIPSAALQTYECADCGPVKTKIISLEPNKLANQKVA